MIDDTVVVVAITLLSRKTPFVFPHRMQKKLAESAFQQKIFAEKCKIYDIKKILKSATSENKTPLIQAKIYFGETQCEYARVISNILKPCCLSLFENVS